MDLLHTLGCVIATLTSTAQNGISPWGTLSAPTLPPWIGSTGTIPWGGRTPSNSDPYTHAPFTGVTRYYNFNISRGVIAPDGYEKSVILVNGQFPGPLIEANWGDSIQVQVYNDIETEQQEGTAIHWHGFLQSHTPWEDGTPGVAQCPIPPGSSFTYNFRAELYGSSWYHSHYSAQYSGGLFGPIVVYGPRNVKYDIDLGPIMVNDWWHQDYLTVVEEVLSTNSTGLTFSDNNLINGKMNFDCSTVTAGDTTNCTDNAGLSKFKFQHGKSHRLRFVNSGSEAVQRISIDGHNMTVIANDFVEIEPYTTEVVTIGVGQRVDVVVQANGNPKGAYWLRSNMTSCSLTKQPDALAAIYYDEADTNSVPNSNAWNVPDPGTCTNDDLALTVPEYPIKLKTPSWTQTMEIGFGKNTSGNPVWSFGGISARVDYNTPTLLQVKNKNFQFAPDQNVINFGQNTSVRFVVNNLTPAPHPMHAHGMNMYILAEGPGNYDGTDITRPSNPMRRDVAMVRTEGHLVVQMDVVNPGIWPFHCHIAWHASGGFFSQMVFLPQQIEQYQIPSSVQQNCAAWNAFTKKVVVDQLDSGL
ncbi:multicopper oxidase [Xylariaceae sp. FL0255]|nr:multicopper oxidase [Xylariaceae sp. FL0255]